MLSTPQIIQTTAQAAAVIHLPVPRSDMMKVFGPAVGELMATLAAQGVKPEGALFTHHLKMSADTFDFELGVKVSTRGVHHPQPAAVDGALARWIDQQDSCAG